MPSVALAGIAGRSHLVGRIQRASLEATAVGEREGPREGPREGEGEGEGEGLM